MTNTRLHPTTRIFCLVMLAILMPAMTWPFMLALLWLLCLLQWPARCTDWRRLMRRARWLLVSLLLIYAFSTPGEYLPNWPDCCGPTYEGLQQGALQALRLTLMLAALALVLAYTTRENLIAGMITIARPLRLLGLVPERFAARLWLTLYYVEHTPPGLLNRLRISHGRLEQLMADTEMQPRVLRIPLPAWSWLDAVVLIVWLLIGGWLI